MRLSYLAQYRLDLAETAKHWAQRMSEPREFNFVPLKRAARCLVGKPKAALRFRRQKHVDKITVSVASDFAGDPVTRKSTTGLVAQILDQRFRAWQHWALERRSFTQWWNWVKLDYPWDLYTRIWNSNEDWNPKWQLDGEFFDESIGSRTANETHWHAVLLDTRTSSRRRPQYQEGANSEELRRCWNEASLCFSITTTLQVCRIGFLVTMDPTLHYKMTVMSRWWIWWWVCRPGDTSTETESCQRWSWTSRRMCQLSETSERWTSLSTSHDGRIMAAIARCKASAICNARFCEHWLMPNLARTFKGAHERAMTERAETGGIRTRLWLYTSRRRSLRHPGLVEMQLTKLGHFELFR